MPKGWKVISIPDYLYEYFHDNWEYDKKMLRVRYGIRSFSGYVCFLLKEMFELNDILREFNLTEVERVQMLAGMATTWLVNLWNNASEEEKKLLEEKGIAKVIQLNVQPIDILSWNRDKARENASEEQKRLLRTREIPQVITSNLKPITVVKQKKEKKSKGNRKEKGCEQIVEYLLKEDYPYQLGYSDLEKAIMLTLDVIDERTIKRWITVLETFGYIVPIVTNTTWQLNPKPTTISSEIEEEEKR